MSTDDAPTYTTQRAQLLRLRTLLDAISSVITNHVEDDATPDSIALGLRAALHNIEVANMMLRGCSREYEMRGRPRR